MELIKHIFDVCMIKHIFDAVKWDIGIIQSRFVDIQFMYFI